MRYQVVPTSICGLAYVDLLLHVLAGFWMPFVGGHSRVTTRTSEV